jgi:hypothetical protein
MRYLTLAEVLYLHDEAIRRFGGRTGIRDLGLPLSALNRPRMAMGGRDLYPSLGSVADRPRTFVSKRGCWPESAHVGEEVERHCLP